MYRTSAAYKEERRKHEQNRSFVYVFLGLIQRDAQNSARITSQLADFAKDDIFEGSRFEGYFATLEENVATADTYFMPESSTFYSAMNQGAVTRDLLGSMTFSFGQSIERFGGLTIDFGEYYPTKFTVTNGNQTYTFENDTAGRYTAIGNFFHSEYITITPISMVGGQQRMRIHSIMFGIGFQFTNRDLISTKRVNEIDHLSRELPKRTFEFTINNLNQMWTMDNPNSYARVLEEKQIVEVTYGRELDDGTIYKIPSLDLALNSWSSTHTTATFKAVGYLDYSNTTYYGGRLGQTTLYDLAETVLTDMGESDYFIDPLLRKLTTNNPLPIDTHKACLQMIANAGLCVLYEDANGVITIKSSIIPQYEYSVTNYESYSNLDNLMNAETVYNHATLETDYATADTYFFEEKSIEQTGAVSYLYPTNQGMSITVQFEAVWTFVGLTLQFGIISPSTVTIAEYKDGSLSETNDYTVDKLNFFIYHEFFEVDKIVITFKDVTDGTRIHLNKILLGNVTDYEITKQDWASYPVATQTERVKSVNVKYYDFIESDKVVSATANAVVGRNLVTFQKPCYDYEVDNGTIVESGAYYVVFNSSVEDKVKITAKEYEKAAKTYSMQLRETGNDLTLENDLISDGYLAKRVCEWFAEFYAGEVDYTINYRGEPALESGDRIYLANSFVNKNLVLVTSEELSTSTGMGLNNTVKARQLSYERMD